MNTVNGYRNFSFGDIIIFTDKDIDKNGKIKNLNLLKLMVKIIFCTTQKKKKLYYFNKFVKVKEEQKKITTWELSDEIK